MDQPARPDRSTVMRDLVYLMREPGDPRRLLATACNLHSIERKRSLAKTLSWFTTALIGCDGEQRRLLTGNAGMIQKLFVDCAPGDLAPTAITRLCASIPMSAAFWDILSLWHRRRDEAHNERRSLKRALLVDPRAPRRWGDLAHNRHWIDRTDIAGIVNELHRAVLINPTYAPAHRYLALFRVEGCDVDALTPPRLLNSLRRWIMLDSQIETHGQAIVATLRRIGAGREIGRIAGWLNARVAARGGLKYSRSATRWLDIFEKEVDELAPFDIDIDFAPRVFGKRVLLHPKLPDTGPWVVRGPAEMVDRALRILRFVNPNASVLHPEDEDSGTARTLSLVPSDDPDCWYLPCLWGHWHVWWSVLPAILDENGRPSLDRLISFSIRTRQFVTFWYAKGHERDYIAQHRDLGQRIADRLGDEASRQNYLETMDAHRPTYIRRFFTEVAHRLQYFDYAVYRPGDVVLNLGVSEGFEVPAYLAIISPGGVLHNIDPEGNTALGAPARAWIEGTDCAVHVHEVALSDVDGEISMETGGCWEDTRVSKRNLGNVKTLPAKRLDTFIAENAIDKIDHIKLDIEGGEGFLLDQLIAVMKSHRPQIEISIYHTVEQFFDIPDRMMRESEGYRFYFHHYCGHFGEGTLYAIPEEIAPLMPIKA